MNGWQTPIHVFVVQSTKSAGSERGVLFPPQSARVVRVSGFVHAAQSALARGLFGNVVGPVKEFTD